MPLFTVVIPLYNKQQYIARTLQTVFAQTFTDYEVIVINDGSTDMGAVIVTAFTDARLTYIETENRGVSAARNTGIEQANGSLIAFLDADDQWEPNHLETLYLLYSQYPDAGILASRHYIKNPGSSALLKPVFSGITDDFTGIVPDFFGSSLINRIAWTSALAVPKKVFDAVGMFSENVTHPEDTEMWIRIAIKYSVALGNIYTAIYNFEIPGSLSKRQMAGRKIMDFTAFIDTEKDNPGLQAFLDIYRLEYALKFKTEGDTVNFKKLYEQVSPENISSKTRVLLLLPSPVLRMLQAMKQYLYSKGIILSAYR